ncbi:hypothetical protein THASP1DRAFT_25549 [Thamnocephalis sphaerospora]|uniref:Uncharacterized protein n=1 Tax=Thamnocephalis sphaerospora TaxID=78915 RepID=A0A4P9XJU2_9FUNG|nr:hypothetical protein THASP1DRAFT_25549 [Thamnocephalis sphaerospora]|eukprot:RKP06057.1 hypothetical protein THASP1DRAFT_25549 [Thamnocephalis sphaerospora]
MTSSVLLSSTAAAILALALIAMESYAGFCPHKSHGDYYSCDYGDRTPGHASSQASLHGGYARFYPIYGAGYGFPWFDSSSARHGQQSSLLNSSSLVGSFRDNQIGADRMTGSSTSAYIAANSL